MLQGQWIPPKALLMVFKNVFLTFICLEERLHVSAYELGLFAFHWRKYEHLNYANISSFHIFI